MALYVWLLSSDYLLSALDLHPRPRISASHKVNELLRVLANERFKVVAGDVVPFDPVIIKVVQD